MSEDCHETRNYFIGGPRKWVGDLPPKEECDVCHQEAEHVVEDRDSDGYTLSCLCEKCYQQFLDRRGDLTLEQARREALGILHEAEANRDKAREREGEENNE